ncbi:sialidase family protein [Foetidibacter luteolus]|uniref:sialidase family protein n=1 Tax=Foetidibacter luteolus TaxID=2608880 RepID=UPI00129BF63E|nr:sialidase family protein [Foetidibacter luteolus]
MSIGEGGMPNIISVNDELQVIYGAGDSILFSGVSLPGKTSPVTPVGILPELAASHSRGPQIAVTTSGTTVLAANADGDIYAYLKDKKGKWLQGGRVNDVDTTAKEGLMALAGDGAHLFAVWLDLRSKHNQIFGAGSTDGGKSWSENRLVYASPDTTVCECCKPSVEIKGDHIAIMFRNWLGGNRNLYLIESHDGGQSFGTAQKLGSGNWKLNGCPMDGGSLAIQSDNTVQTVWRREGNIFACQSGQPEKEIGQGKGCTMTLVNDRPVYAWVEDGNITCLLPGSVKKVLGKGSYPVLRAVNSNTFACIWESDKQIQLQFINL